MSLPGESADWHARRIGLDDTTRTRTEGRPSDEPTLPGDGRGFPDDLPKTIDRFRVIRRVGSGGMGGLHVQLSSVMRQDWRISNTTALSYLGRTDVGVQQGAHGVSLVRVLALSYGGGERRWHDRAPVA